jgi:molecular chaperone GrpE
MNETAPHYPDDAAHDDGAAAPETTHATTTEDAAGASAEQPQSPEAIAAALQAVIAEKDEEIAALKDQSLRALAEVENIRRRSEREKNDAAKFGASKLAGDLVSVVENLHRAVDSITDAHKESSPLFKNLAMGVEMTLKELHSVLEKHGISRIDPTGQPFNHEQHQALSQIEHADAPEGTVLQVMQACYMMHDRLLSPAMVAVAKAPATPDDSAPDHIDTQA